MNSALWASLATLVALAQAGTPISTLCGQYDTYSGGGYLWNNDLWGEGSATGGQQCTYVFSDDPSGVAWTSTWTWSGGEGEVKSYANVGLQVPQGKLISDINSMATTVSWSYDDTDVNVDIAYDLFTDPDASHSASSGQFELMIWLGKYGSNQPIGSQIDSTTIGGTDWAVWNGSALAGQTTYSFVAPNIIGNWTGDVVDFWQYLENSQGFPADQQYLLTYQFGSEPQTGGQTTLTVSSFTASLS